VSFRWPSPPEAIPAPDLPQQPAARRVKVLHVVTKLRGGGGGNVLLSALGTDPSRYETWVVGADGGPLWERAEAGGVRTVKLRRFREVIAPVDDLVVLVELVRLIRRERFTIVHTHLSKGGVLGRLAAAICHTPVVVHTYHAFSFHDFMGPLRRWVYLFLERLMQPMTDAFLAVSPGVAREAVERRLARPGSISVVPSGVELEGIPVRPDPAVRGDLRIPEGVPVVGTVGRVAPQKAPADFVEMAARVARSHPEVRFVVVGDGPLLDHAKERACRLGVDVLFTGFRPDASRIASAFDVFVISSLYEGLGRALTEAMASGRPIVATAVNGVPDLVEPGVTGLLASPANPPALAALVTWLLEHPDEARRMGERGRARVRSSFDPSTMCELLDATYRRLLGLPRETPVTSSDERGAVARLRPSRVAPTPRARISSGDGR